MTCDTAYCTKDTHSAQTSGSFAAQGSSRCVFPIFTSSGGYGGFTQMVICGVSPGAVSICLSTPLHTDLMQVTVSQP